MGNRSTKITLTADEIEYLETQTKARTIQAQTVTRAKVLLLRSEGNTIKYIADKLDINRNSVILCLNKYLDGGVENALFDAPRRGRNPEISDDEKSWIINIACQKPSDLSLLAAIDLQTGEAIPLVREKHSSEEYIEFLKILDSKYPQKDKIRIVLDNLKVHSSKETSKYLAAVPGRFEFVFTPKHGSWLNMIEGFFSKMTRQMLRGIRVKSKPELIDRIYKYFDEVNEVPVVFHWKYKLDQIDSSELPVTQTLI